MGTRQVLKLVKDRRNDGVGWRNTKLASVGRLRRFNLFIVLMWVNKKNRRGHKLARERVFLIEHYLKW